MVDEREHFMPPTLMGTVYWKDHVVGTIDDHADGERAVEELRAAGFAADDANAWTSDFVLENHEFYLKNRSPLQRLGSLMPNDDAMEEIVDEVRNGHSVVTVRAPDREAARRAGAILHEHHARHVRWLQANTFEEL